MTTHRWSGWPGAFCLKCGAPDPIEQALADDVFDPFTGEWTDPDAKAAADRAAHCEITDERWAQHLADRGLFVPPDVAHLVKR